MRFLLLFIVLIALSSSFDEPIRVSGKFSEWVAIDSLPYRNYPYQKYWSKDSLTRFYCIPQEGNIYCVGLKRLKESKFIWNPKYLKREVLP